MNPVNQPLPQTPNTSHPVPDAISEVEACRICLATDVKMYSLQGTNLGRRMDSFAGFDKTNQTLPKYVCYECAHCLVKSSKLLEKCRKSEITISNILAKNGQITKSLIQEQNRSQLNLQSPLDRCLLVNYFHIRHNDVKKTLNFIEPEKSSSNADPLLNKEIREDDDVIEIKIDVPLVVISDDEGSNDKIPVDERLETKPSQKDSKPIPQTTSNTKATENKIKKNHNNLTLNIDHLKLTPEEVQMQEYFHIVKSKVPPYGTYTCKSCSKTWSNMVDVKQHKLKGCIAPDKSTSYKTRRKNRRYNNYNTQPYQWYGNQPRFWNHWNENQPQSWNGYFNNHNNQPTFWNYWNDNY